MFYSISVDTIMFNENTEQVAPCEDCDNIEDRNKTSDQISNQNVIYNTNDVPVPVTSNDDNINKMDIEPDNKSAYLKTTSQTEKLPLNVSQNEGSLHQHVDNKTNEQSDERIITITQTGQTFEKRKHFLQRFPSIEDEWLDNEGEHMFVKGIPKPNNDSKKVVKQIISKFNTSLDSSLIETKRKFYAKTRKSTVTSGSFSRNKMMVKTFEGSNGNEIEPPRIPWAAERRINFRISSFSRDVPRSEQPDLHKEFKMDETIKIVNEQSSTKGAKSLLHFIEKSIVKNQN